uniref:Uncharacterized protein n=1 Tax=Clastoptera arizonana TaxID=38151 RepID=A0A1B6DD74_9HEMI
MDFKLLILVLGSVYLAGAQYNPYNPYYRPAGFVPILSQNFDLNPDGSYKFGYRSADGSARDEAGALKYRGTAVEAMGVQGSYAYQSPEGPVAVNYIADENGFQPTGNSVHPAIQRAVALQVAEAQGKAVYPGGPYYPGNPYYPYRKY